MSNNLKIYNEVRQVPKQAQKKIKGGRLSGMTDINPMWRIKKLTELFGPCGFGWKYEITEKRLEEGGNNEIAAFVDINLYVNQDGEWSEPIPGTGGSTFVAKERKGLYTSDECYKMALTDAISVACKPLGFGADIYWSADRTKYSNKRSNEQKYTNKRGKTPKGGKHPPSNKNHIQAIRAIYKADKDKVEPIILEYLDKRGFDDLSAIGEMSSKQSAKLLNNINKKLSS